MVAFRDPQLPDETVASLHDHVLSMWPRPAWLASENLLANTWSVRTDDARKKRRASRNVYFDVVLAPQGVRSTDPSLEHDLLTAKLIVYQSLRPGFAGGITSSAAYAPMIAREYFAFARWRLSRGIRANADLSREWLDEYYATLRKQGPQGLLPLRQRAVELVARYEKYGLPYPTNERSFRKDPLALLQPLAHEIGVDNALSLSHEARDYLLEAIGRRGIATTTERLAKAQRRPGMRARRVGDHDGWTPSRLAILLRPIELIFRFRRHLGHDRIPFDPFENGSLWKTAQSLATRELRRIPTVPAAQACHLIDAALTWVLEYAPDILMLAAQLESELVGTKDPQRRHKTTTRVFRQFRPSTLSHDHAVWGDRSPAWARKLLTALLPGACIVVIAAFSARRHEEIESLQAGAVERSGDDYWLNTWISKTIRSVEKIPVPASVANAVGVLEALSHERRSSSGEPWILDIRPPGGANGRTCVRRALTTFAEVAGVPPLPDGSNWWFTPHQFRRFFGITYYHRYRFPHLAALSQFYRHFDPDMTRVYISESALGSFLRLEEERRLHETALERAERQRDTDRRNDFLADAQNFRLDLYRSVLRGNERATGFGGDVLTHELQTLEANVRSQLEIEAPGTDGEGALNQALVAFAAGTRLEPNPLGHGYCRCRSTPTDLRAANCLRQSGSELSPTDFAVAPDPAHASDRVCAACPHNVQLPENESYWRRVQEHETQQAKCALGSLLEALSEERRDFAEAHIHRCFS